LDLIGVKVNNCIVPKMIRLHAKNFIKNYRESLTSSLFLLVILKLLDHITHANIQHWSNDLKKILKVLCLFLKKMEIHINFINLMLYKKQINILQFLKKTTSSKEINPQMQMEFEHFIKILKILNLLFHLIVTNQHKKVSIFIMEH
jgi:hypothetical protein